MKKSIVFVLACLGLISSAFAADLPSNATPKFIYKDVTIYSVKSAKLKTSFTSDSFTYVAFHKGTLDLDLEVEGNICLADAKTFGLKTEKKLDTLSIGLIAGTKLPIPENTGCAHYGRSLVAKVSLDIFFSVFRNRKPISAEYIIPVGHMGKTVSLRVFERNGELELKY